MQKICTKNETKSISSCTDTNLVSAQNEVGKSGLTRRSFLKTSAAFAGAAAAICSVGCSAIAPGGKVNSEAEEQVFTGMCIANCNGACRLAITVREGKIVSTTMAEFPDPDYNRICLKGLNHPLRIYGPLRLKYPMRRVGERGADQWEQITWDEALTLLTDTWENVRNKYGASANAISAGAVRLGSLAPTMLSGMIGGTSLAASDDQAVDYIMPQCIGRTLLCSGSEPRDIKNAKKIFSWGCNPTNSNLQQVHWLLDALDNGAKLVAVGPNFTHMAAKADRFIRIKQGTDAVMFMALSNYLVKNDLADLTFLAEQTVAPFLVKASDKTYLRASDLGIELPEPVINPQTGEAIDLPIVVGQDGMPTVMGAITDPKIEGNFTFGEHKVTTAYSLLLDAIAPYTLEKAEEICGVSVADGEWIASLFADKEPLAVTALPGMDHYYNGHQPYHAMAALLMVSGHLGSPGNGSYYATYLTGGAVNWAAIYMPSDYPPSPEIPWTSLNDVCEKKTFNGHPQEIKSIVIWGKEAISGQMDKKRLLQSFDQMELVTVVDLEMNDTARYADLILPVAYFFESIDCAVTGTSHSYNILGEQAIEPLYESLNDYDIVVKIAEKLGLKWPYASKEDFLRVGFDSDLYKAAGITFDKLKEEKVMNSVPAFMLNEEGCLILGAGGVYGTDTGKAQFYLETVEPRVVTGIDFDKDSVRLPAWDPPYEAWDESEAAKKYSINLLQSHSKWRSHSTFAKAEWLRELVPEPVIYISPEDAAKRSIENGDIVKVYNDRGYVVIKALIDSGIAPGSLFVGNDGFIFLEWRSMTFLVATAYWVKEEA